MQKRYFALVIMAFIFTADCIVAQNTTETVSTVSSEVVLDTPKDYVVTSTMPFTTVGVVDIRHDDAVLIIPNQKPSQVLSSWMSNIRVRGEAATRNNVWVGIYNNGAIVYPHPKIDFTPLTVYKEINYGGESTNKFIPYAYYNNPSLLDGFENEVRSMKLKRGYMATLACNADGTGYSRVFIAQDADIEIPELQKELKGRVGFIRVFPWNKTTKKGWAGYDWTENTMMNTTWNYGWDCNGGVNNEDFEYVAMHHHENWPTMDEVASLNNCNTVLGNNEPDNAGDPSQGPLDFAIMEEVLFGKDGLTGNWHNIYKSGLRVGSPAMAGNPRDVYLSTFMDLCKKYNYRIDFIAVHRYWVAGGGDYDWDMNETWNKYHLPMWLTEWNYGAEWTSWPGPNWDLTEENQIIERNGVADIVTALEANPRVERYSFFNHMISQCRHLVVWGDQGAWATKAGEWYAKLKSNTAYTNGENYQMVWNHWAPKDLTVTFDNRKKTASLAWTNLNGKQTDSTHIERKLDGETSWSVIAKCGMSGSAYLTYRSDTLKGISGLVTYRVRNFDSDGRIRVSGEAELSVGGSAGNDTFKYGTITLTDGTTPVKVDFNTPYSSVPALFVSPMSDNNPKTNAGAFFKAGSITASGFTYTPLVWSNQPNGETTFSKNEEVSFITVPVDNYSYGDMDIEVGNLTLRDTTYVEFKKTFDEGVKPVVVVTATRTTQNDSPLLTKVWDVTNRGFWCTVEYEAGENKVVALNQQLSYMAATPGHACVDEEAGMFIAAGHGGRKVYSLAREEIFEVIDPSGVKDTLYLEEPIVLAQLQTANPPVGTNLRLTSKVMRNLTDEDGALIGAYTTGVRLRRVVDLSSGVANSTVDNTKTSDEVGWIALHTTPHYGTQTGIGNTFVVESENPLRIDVENGVIIVDGHRNFDVYALNGSKVDSGKSQSPGVYIVRAGGKVAKVSIGR